MPILALTLCTLFIIWFVARDCMARKAVSAAVWIPTALLLILGSRPVSLWATGGRVWVGEMGNAAEGSALDLFFFLFVLAASLFVASSRNIKWGKLLAGNPAIILLYLYFLVSVSWSGDPMGSLKRIIKEIGLLFVIGVIFSEKDPLQAMRAVFVRCAAVLIPLSVVFIKYFPSYSRAYTIAGGMMETGVTTQKNTLGEIVLVFTLFLVWDYFETQRTTPKRGWSRVPWDRLLLLLMGVWLLRGSQSKTALLCTVVGVALIVRNTWLVSKMVNRIVLCGALSLPFLLFFSQEFASVIAPFIKALGRDMTFTGRANIWAQVTATTVNPIVGAGYWNFWGGPGGFAISQAMKTVVPNAHCGYVDIYLDGGIVGLILLFLLLVVYGRRIIKYLGSHRDETRYFRVRFAFLIVAIIYNLGESTFVRMGAIWFSTLLMLVDYPWKPLAEKTTAGLRQRKARISQQVPSILVNQ
jgi:exopolysaccharide production protein ExoQ